MASIMYKGKCNSEVFRKIMLNYLKRDVDISNPMPQPATSRGSNFVSDAWRLSFFITENGKTKNETVIVKARPANEAQNALMHTDIAFKNEVLAYEKIIPTLNKYAYSPIRVPKYIYGDPTTIVLEDMRQSGFEIVNKKLATEWNRIWSPIQEIAKLHAASITMEQVDKANFNFLKDQIIEVPLPESTPLGEKQARVLDTILGVLFERNEDSKYMEIVENLKKNAWKDQKEIVQKEVPIRVINHGSPWINNFLFRDDLIALLDLQHIVYSTPANDLSYFLYVNLDPEFLAHQRQNILRFYLLNLHGGISDKMGVSHASKILASLNYEWIDKEVQRCGLYAYMMAQWIMPVFYWSDVVYHQLEFRGGLENMSIPERLSYLPPEQKDRIIKLTKLFVHESSQN